MSRFQNAYFRQPSVSERLDHSLPAVLQGRFNHQQVLPRAGVIRPDPPVQSNITLQNEKRVLELRLYRQKHWLGVADRDIGADDGAERARRIFSGPSLVRRAGQALNIEMRINHATMLNSNE